VAEVVRYAPLQADRGRAHWFRGHVAWNGRRVPVISFEELAGLTPAEPGGRTRVAILSAIGGRLSAGFFGVLTEGFPAAGAGEPGSGGSPLPVRPGRERAGDLPDPDDQRVPADPDLEAIEDLIEDAVNPREELLS